MTLSFRRLVTGRDANGRSVLLEDARIAEGRLGNFNFWRTQAAAAGTDIELARLEFPFFADPGGTVFRVFRLPIAPPDLTPQQARELSAGFFAEIGVPSCRVDTSRHPLMHVTPTTDYIMLLSGEVSLLLDAGEPIPLQPFDVVIQRNTNHAWINTGREAAVLMAVMIGQP
jgi:naringenin degradation protein FdeH